MDHSERFPGTFGMCDIPQCNPAHHTPNEFIGGGALHIQGYNDGSNYGHLSSSSGGDNMANIEKRLANLEKMVTAIYKALSAKK